MKDERRRRKKRRNENLRKMGRRGWKARETYNLKSEKGEMKIQNKRSRLTGWNS